jgi:hypothetical protein
MKTILELISGYKKYLISAALVLALVFGGKMYVSNLEKTAHDLGYQESEQVWDKKRSDMQKTIDEKFVENTLLAAALRARTAEKQKALEALTKSTAEKQAVYAASQAGKTKVVDDQFVDIYNESLGEK